MPELPEVEALTRFLTAETQGHVIAKVMLASLQALKTFDPPLEALVGRQVRSWSRRGKYLILDVSDDQQLFLVAHLSRGGWVKRITTASSTPIKLGKGPLALRVIFDDGSGIDFTEAGTEKRLSISIVRSPDDIEHVATLGPDVLAEDFTPAALAAILAEHNKQLKGVLTDQSLLAGVGNAYSDEALHIARLSPFRKASSLSEEEVEELHRALRQVMTEAIERSDGLGAKDLKSDKKANLRVHGRTGQPCPVCGDTVRQVAFASKSLQYCPTCQTGGKVLADRRFSRLLK